MSQPETKLAPDGLIALLLAYSDSADPRVATLLAAHPLEVLARFDADALRVAGGLSSRQAARLAAAFALGREVERASRPHRARLDRPAAVARLLAPEVRGLEVETFHTLVLDARHELVAHERVAVGTLMNAPVHPREVFRPALRRTCAAIIVAHNHPSGDPEPSAEDLAVTQRLVEAGRILGVPLLDHVVLGEGRWVSLRERGALGEPSPRAAG
jgi:DNA repair protein RadC